MKTKHCLHFCNICKSDYTQLESHFEEEQKQYKKNIDIGYCE
jgi:hypothetical protein